MFPAILISAVVLADKAHAPFPVWWLNDDAVWIPSQSDCARLWDSPRPGRDATSQLQPVTFREADSTERSVRTCREWSEAQASGATLIPHEMGREEAAMEAACARLSAVACMRPSVHSAFAGQSHTTLARACSETVQCDTAGEAQAKPSGVTTQSIPHGVVVRDAEGVELVKVLAKGDLDGDGWEDLLVGRWSVSDECGRENFSYDVVTRVGTGGPLVPITDRLRLQVSAKPAPSTGKPEATESTTIHPVWWLNDATLTIQSAADCERLWNTWRPKPDEGSDPYEVEMTMKDDRKVTARTCKEWAAAMDAGGYAYTTVDMTMQSWFLDASARLAMVPALVPSRHSAFAGQPFRAYAPALSEYCMYAAASRLRQAAKPDRITSSVKGDEFSCVLVDAEWEEMFRVVARGDYNGDGWEDLVVSSAQHALSGSGRSYDWAVYTQVGKGRLIPITAQASDRPLTPEQMTQRRAAIARSFGLPEDREITLRGTLKDATETLPVTCRLRFKNGFATGSYQYDRVGKPIELSGSLGFDGALLLREFGGAGSVPTGDFRLDYAVEGGRLRVKGFWHDQNEGFDVQLEGALPR